MKTKTGFIRFCIATVASVAMALAGCLSTPQGKALTYTGVALVVGKVCDNNMKHVPRIAEIAGEIRAAARGDTFDTVSAVILAIRAKIDVNKLSFEERDVMEALVVALEAELTDRLGSGLLSPEKRLTVGEIAAVVESTAKRRLPVLA